MKLNTSDSALGATSLRGSSPAWFWLVRSQIFQCLGQMSAELEALAAGTPCPVQRELLPARPQQRQDGDEDKTRQLLQRYLAHAQHLIMNNLLEVGGVLRGKLVTQPGWVGIISGVSSAQGSRVRTVRRTSTTVQATTARMGAPAWTASTPTTASAHLSGQVVLGMRVAQGWAGRMDPAQGDVGHSEGRAVLLHIGSSQCQLHAGALSPGRSVLH